MHSSMDNVDVKASVNIMLTPEFYTHKREELPVKYAYQAKKIAASLFDGLLDSEGEYEYAVFKEEAYWSFVAYDIHKITAFLDAKGLYADKIGKIYFAQQSIEKFVKPLPIGEKKILTVLDNTVVVVPRILAKLDEEDSNTLNFDHTFTPTSAGVNIQGNSSDLLTQTQALSLAAIFMLFAGIFIVEGMRYAGSNENNAELKSLQEQHPGLNSIYTRQGIIDKYKKMNQDERRKRDIIKSLSKIIFKGVTLTKVNIDNQNFKAEYVCSTEHDQKRAKELAKKAQLSIAKTKETNKLIVEGTL